MCSSDLRYATEVVPTLKGGSRDMPRIRTLKAHLGKYAVASITSALVAQYRDSRLATISKSTGTLVGPQTVKHELGMLQRVLKKGAMEWGVLLPGGILTLQVKMPRLPNSRDRRLVDDEEARLLGGCSESNAAWLYPAVILAIETAMRASELLGLRWDNIDLKGRVAVLPDTKNGTVRRVPLSFRAVDAFLLI